MQTVFERNPVAPGLIDRALAGSVRTPFWLDDLPARTAYPQLTASSPRYDLVVVGGGYTGLWSALRALQRDPGIRVAVLEGQTIGWAASGRPDPGNRQSWASGLRLDRTAAQRGGCPEADRDCRTPRGPRY